MRALAISRIGWLWTLHFLRHLLLLLFLLLHLLYRLLLLLLNLLRFYFFLTFLLFLLIILPLSQQINILFPFLCLFHLQIHFFIFSFLRNALTHINKICSLLSHILCDFSILNLIFHRILWHSFSRHIHHHNSLTALPLLSTSLSCPLALHPHILTLQLPIKPRPRLLLRLLHHLTLLLASSSSNHLVALTLVPCLDHLAAANLSLPIQRALRRRIQHLNRVGAGSWVWWVRGHTLLRLLLLRLDSIT